MFRYANPEMLWLLAVIPLLALVFVYSIHRRKSKIRRFGDPETVATLMPEFSHPKILYKFILLEAALVMIIFALARPQIGSKLKEMSREGVEIMFAVDVSNSMLAEDFTPNRLERTKYSIGRLLENLEEDRVGLIIFAGDAYVQLPVTSDYVAARNFSRQITNTSVTKQGTAIGAAIDLAVSSFSSESEGSRVIILISDGENHEDDALGAAMRAAEKGVSIYSIGIGTPEGAPIEIGGDFIRDPDGNMVVSRLDETLLEQIALETGGAYIRATDRSMGLDEIVSRINETEKRLFSSQIFDEYDEKYRYFLAIGLFLLLCSWAILPRKNRWISAMNVFGEEKQQ